MTRPRIRSDPTLHPVSLLGLGLRGIPPPLDTPGVSFWFSGRVALFHAIRALGLQPGDAVAVPAFCCGSEVDPFVQAGLVPRFFGITSGLDPEPESFRAAVHGAAAALVIHYFGFAAGLEDARAACREAGIPLIEDCAHSLYSRDASGAWLGAGADVAVFSIMKTLPVPDGGALLLNVRSARPLAQGVAPPGKLLIAKRTGRLVIRELQAHPFRPLSWAAHLPRAAKDRLGLTAPEPSRETQAGMSSLSRFDPAFANTGMSARSLRLFKSTDHEEVRRARRCNYQRLQHFAGRARGLRLLFPTLPAGACPLFLPVVAENPADFRRRLGERPGLGVQQVWPWFHPSARWERFANERALKDAVFNIPIHQSLHASDIERIMQALDSWSAA